VVSIETNGKKNKTDGEKTLCARVRREVYTALAVTTTACAAFPRVNYTLDPGEIVVG